MRKNKNKSINRNLICISKNQKMSFELKYFPTKSYKQLNYDLKIKFNDVLFISRNVRQRLTIGILSFDLHQSTIKFFLIALKLFLPKFSFNLKIQQQYHFMVIKVLFSKKTSSRKAKNLGKTLEKPMVSKKMQGRIRGKRGKK